MYPAHVIQGLLNVEFVFKEGFTFLEHIIVYS